MDTLKDAIKAAFQADSVLGTMAGPYTDGWQASIGDSEWWRITQVPSPAYTRFLGRVPAAPRPYVDRQVWMLQAICETEDRADEMSNAMNNLFNNPVVIQPLEGGGRTMSCQRIGNPTVIHYNPPKSLVSRNNTKDTGDLSECWIASGTWMFILQKTLGVN